MKIRKLIAAMLAVAMVICMAACSKDEPKENDKPAATQAEATPEATVEPTAEPTSEATEEPSITETPEVTQSEDKSNVDDVHVGEVTPEPTGEEAEVTATPEVTPEVVSGDADITGNWKVVDMLVDDVSQYPDVSELEARGIYMMVLTLTEDGNATIDTLGETETLRYGDGVFFAGQEEASYEVEGNLLTMRMALDGMTECVIWQKMTDDEVKAWTEQDVEVYDDIILAWLMGNLDEYDSTGSENPGTEDGPDVVTDPGESDGSPVGYWKMVSMEGSGADYATGNDQIKMLADLGYFVVLKVDEDGTSFVDFYDEKDHMKYNDKYFAYNMEDMDDWSNAARYTVQGDTLTLVSEMDGGRTVFKKMTDTEISQYQSQGTEGLLDAMSHMESAVN